MLRRLFSSGREARRLFSSRGLLCNKPTALATNQDKLLNALYVDAHPKATSPSFVMWQLWLKTPEAARLPACAYHRLNDHGRSCEAVWHIGVLDRVVLRISNTISVTATYTLIDDTGAHCITSEWTGSTEKLGAAVKALLLHLDPAGD